MGILGIFYVQPYKDGTHAALYEALRYRTPYQQIQNPAPYQQNTAMNQQTTEMPPLLSSVDCLPANMGSSGIHMTLQFFWMHLFLIHWKWDVNVSI